MNECEKILIPLGFSFEVWEDDMPGALNPGAHKLIRPDLWIAITSEDLELPENPSEKVFLHIYSGEFEEAFPYEGLPGQPPSAPDGDPPKYDVVECANLADALAFIESL